MICFLFHVHKEPREQVSKLVDKLFELYTSCDIRIIYDGVPSFDIERVGNWSTLKLKVPEYGGQWTQRFLYHYLTTSNAKWLIKIDPDTVPLKPIEDLPTTRSIFARTYKTVTPKGILHTPHGGAQGYTRDMAHYFTFNKLMVDGKFANNSKYNCIQDLMLRDVIHQYKLELIRRTDFACAEIATPTSTFFHP